MRYFQFTITPILKGEGGKHARYGYETLNRGRSGCFNPSRLCPVSSQPWKFEMIVNRSLECLKKVDYKFEKKINLSYLNYDKFDIYKDLENMIKCNMGKILQKSNMMKRTMVNFSVFLPYPMFKI